MRLILYKIGFIDQVCPLSIEGPALIIAFVIIILIYKILNHSIIRRLLWSTRTRQSTKILLDNTLL